MARMIGAVIGGYLVIVGLVFVLFSAAYFLLGAEGSFKPGSYQVSTTWIVVSFVLGFVAAVAGGYTAIMIAPRSRAVTVLVGVVLVLGLLMAIPVLMAMPAKAERTDDVGSMDAMRKAQQPVWVALLNPLVGTAGVLAGGGLRKPNPSAQT